MSDDVWRHRARDDENFGPPLFGEDADSDDAVADDARPGRKADKPIVFDDSTGSMPHWTVPATGEVPRVSRPPRGEVRDPTDDLDVWSSFSGNAPVWGDDKAVADPSARYDDFSDMPRSAALNDGAAPEDPFFDVTDADISGAITATRREPGRITIGTDPTDEGIGRPTPSKGRSRTSREEQARAARSGRPSGAVRAVPADAICQRQ